MFAYARNFCATRFTSRSHTILNCVISCTSWFHIRICLWHGFHIRISHIRIPHQVYTSVHICYTDPTSESHTHFPHSSVPHRDLIVSRIPHINSISVINIRCTGVTAHHIRSHIIIPHQEPHVQRIARDDSTTRFHIKYAHPEFSVPSVVHYQCRSKSCVLLSSHQNSTSGFISATDSTWTSTTPWFRHRFHQDYMWHWSHSND